VTIRRNALAAAWGFAEACFFFIVPDVLLSWIALTDVRRALLACLYALAGALLGGTLVWFWGGSQPELFRHFFVALPGMDSDLLAAVRIQLQEQGLTAVLFGPLRGTPYKLYALEASVQRYPYLPFLLISIPARLIRFVLVTLLVGCVRRLLGEHLSPNGARWTHLICWTVFYAWYLLWFPGWTG
jgi:membrane protein YqaA with SNARE-associated domain